MRLGRAGPYQLQAAVAAVHSQAPSVSRAELLHRAGDVDGARAAYRRAIALTDDTRERAALERRAATLPGAAHA